MLTHWKEKSAELRERLTRVPRLLIASDFDGTLSPLVDHQSEAALHPDAPRLLKSLTAMYPRVRLAFLSGRSLKDLSTRLGLGLDRIILGGNHGLELRGAGLDWTHPASTAARPHLEDLARHLRQAVGNIPGVEIEDKDVTLTLHYRRVASTNLSFLHALVGTIALPGGVQRYEGKKVVEFRPPVDWDKGHALRRIMQRLGIPPAAVVYLGDDETDEDAFRELNDTGVTLHIGSASDKSVAQLQACGPEDAIEFLHKITA